MFNWYGPKVQKQIDTEMSKRLKKGAIFLTGRVKETLSVPAPRIRVLGRASGMGWSYYQGYSYRATTPAVKGAPPRKLSGRLRASQTWEFDQKTMRARVGTNVFYGKVHEFANHKYMIVTINKYRGELGRILGNDATITIGSMT